MARNLWVRIRVDNEDKMLRIDDVLNSPLFKKINEIFAEDLEIRRKLKEEINTAARILIKNYPNVDYESNNFDLLEKRIPACKFDIYVPSKDILVGKEFDLD
jgi:hypothetical protein